MRYSMAHYQIVKVRHFFVLLKYLAYLFVKYFVTLNGSSYGQTIKFVKGSQPVSPAHSQQLKYPPCCGGN